MVADLAVVLIMIRISGAIHSGADRGQKPAWSNSTKSRAREGTFAIEMVGQGPPKDTCAGCTCSERRMGQFRGIVKKEIDWGDFMKHCKCFFF